MIRKLFGTDGVRGRANAWPMTPESLLRLGGAIGASLGGSRRGLGGKRKRVLVGKDTRLSGYMVEGALMAGLTGSGVNVAFAGPIPTPAASFLTMSLRADLGLMITASHNGYEDNGIKAFGSDGYKAGRLWEEVVEGKYEEMEGGAEVWSQPEGVGRAWRVEGGRTGYVDFVKRSFPAELTLEGLKVVLDCAHGAAYRAAPEVLTGLGADVEVLGARPDGTNINVGVGSTSPEALCAKTKECGADVGFAFDGDADRVVACDEKGRLVDGDAMLGTLAGSWQDRGALTAPGVVGTLWSNLGLERYLAGRGLGLERAQVGDRHVTERMRKGGYNVGGERSGHVVLLDHARTGDGLVAMVQGLGVLVRTGDPASEVFGKIEMCPQVEASAKVEDADVLEGEGFVRLLGQAREKLGSGGMVAARMSGTEPVARVMAQGDDEGMLRDMVEELSGALLRA